MRRIKSFITVLLLGIWLPVTSHCLLEVAGLIPLNKCCASHGKCDTQPSSHQECSDSCGNLEEASYRSTPQPDLMVLPALFFVVPPALELVDANAAWISALRAGEPPVPVSLASLLVHTSQPVRGPSFIS